jgi:hypothetical protein
MNRCLLILSVLVIALFCVSRCKGDEKNDGVLSEERVINLPQDQGKWYISIVGNEKEARYQEVLGWFSKVDRLKSLKDKVHFLPVTSDSPIYKERYAPNVKGLPTVRVQTESGVVIYEAAGKKIPMSGEGLYTAIADAANGSEALLPWRRRHENPPPTPTPNPINPQPQPDPEPQPIDNGGTPILEPGEQEIPIWPILICIGLLVAGVLWGESEKAKAFYPRK